MLPLGVSFFAGDREEDDNDKDDEGEDEEDNADKVVERGATRAPAVIVGNMEVVGIAAKRSDNSGALFEPVVDDEDDEDVGEDEDEDDDEDNDDEVGCSAPTEIAGNCKPSSSASSSSSPAPSSSLPSSSLNNPPSRPAPVPSFRPGFVFITLAAAFLFADPLGRPLGLLSFTPALLASSPDERGVLRGLPRFRFKGSPVMGSKRRAAGE